MLKIANFSLVLATLGTAYVLYSHEHATRGSERALAREKAAVVDTAEAIKLLKAEWSSLTRPERIQYLAQSQLGMQPIAPDQFVSESELAARLDALTTSSTTAPANPIDDVLKKMQ
jgi:cell division protein FtsL